MAQGTGQLPLSTPCHTMMVDRIQPGHVIHPLPWPCCPLHAYCTVAQSASVGTQVAISHLLYTYASQHESSCPPCSARSAFKLSALRLEHSVCCGRWPHLPKALSSAAWRRARRCRRASSPMEACCATPGVPASRSACNMLPWLTIASGRKAGSQNHTHPDMPGNLPNTLRFALCNPESYSL